MCTFLCRMQNNRIIHIVLAFVSSMFSNFKTFWTIQKCFRSCQCCTDEKSSSAQIWDLVYLSSFCSQDRKRRRKQPRECFLTGTSAGGCSYIFQELNKSRYKLDPHTAAADLKYRPARTIITIGTWVPAAEVIVICNYACLFFMHSMLLLCSILVKKLLVSLSAAEFWLFNW